MTIPKKTLADHFRTLGQSLGVSSNSPHPANAPTSGAALKTASFGPSHLQNHPSQDFMDDEEMMAFAKNLSLITSDPAINRKDAIKNRAEKGGLFNLGATCWLNSLLQAVFKGNEIYEVQLKDHKERYQREIEENKAQNTPDDRERLEKLERITFLSTTLLKILELSEKEPNFEVNEALMNHLELLRDFLSTINPDFKHRQMDPNEALLTLLGPMGLNFLPDVQAPIIPAVYRKTFLRAVDTDSSRSPQRKTLTSQINLSNHQAKSVQDGINLEFMNPIKLEGNERFDFEDGKGHQDTYKVDYFVEGEKLPKELVVQVPRFSTKKVAAWNRNENQMQVEIHGKRHSAPITFEEEIQVPLYNESGSKVTQILTMKLDSVIGHKPTSKESIHGGHYVAYKRNDQGGFTLYDDAKAPQSLSLQAAEENFKNEGYLALYKHVHSKVVGANEIFKYKTLDKVLPPVKVPAPLRVPSEDHEDIFQTPPASPSSRLTTVNENLSNELPTISLNDLDDWEKVEMPLELSEPPKKALSNIENAYKKAVDPYNRCTSNPMPMSKKWVQIHSQKKKSRFSIK